MNKDTKIIKIISVVIGVMAFLLMVYGITFGSNEVPILNGIKFVMGIMGTFFSMCMYHSMNFIEDARGR